jgi:hypothetical protein
MTKRVPIIKLPKFFHMVSVSMGVPLLGTLLGKIHPGDPGAIRRFKESRRFTIVIFGESQPDRYINGLV